MCDRSRELTTHVHHPAGAQVRIEVHLDDHQSVVGELQR